MAANPHKVQPLTLTGLPTTLRVFLLVLVLSCFVPISVDLEALLGIHDTILYTISQNLLSMALYPHGQQDHEYEKD